MNDKKIVLLVGSKLHNLYTLSLFLEERNINVVGACIADKRTKGIDFSYLKHSIKKEGFLNVLSQILQRILYKMLNSKADRRIHSEFYDRNKIEKVISSWSGSIHYTNDYQSQETFKWIQDQSPNLILVHTPYWVGRKIRKLVNDNIIGGHPGLTPYYRGIHSPFWALYNNEPEKLGYSVFFLDAGVDTGDVIHQGSLVIEKGDSYITLGWKGMKEIARHQLRIVQGWSKGDSIPRKKHMSIPPGSNYSHPKLNQYIKYLIKRRGVR